MNDQTNQDPQTQIIPVNNELSDSELEKVAGGKEEGLIEPDWKPLPPPNPGKLINPFQK